MCGEFEPLEPRGALEAKVDLVVVEHVHDRQVVTAGSQQLQAREDSVAIAEQVGDDDDHASLRQGFGDGAEHAVKVAGARVSRRLEHLTDARQL